MLVHVCANHPLLFERAGLPKPVFQAVADTAKLPAEPGIKQNQRQETTRQQT
jgi:hypothetical protein